MKECEGFDSLFGNSVCVCDTLLATYPGLNIIVKLGDKGSRFISKNIDIFMPPITEFN